jgi:hypothetical protein
MKWAVPFDVAIPINKMLGFCNESNSNFKNIHIASPPLCFSLTVVSMRHKEGLKIFTAMPVDESLSGADKAPIKLLAKKDSFPPASIIGN